MAIALVLLSISVAAGARAASIVTAQSGNWDAGTTWVGGMPPGAGDDVTIASSHVITVAVDAEAASVTIAANTSGTNGITISSGIPLNVSGAIIMTAPTAGTATINVGAGTLSAAGIAIPGSATAGRTCVVTVSTGTITVAGSVTFTGTAAQAQFISAGASTVNIGGNLESGGTLTTGGTGTINFNGSAAQTLGTYTTYANVSVSNTSGGVTLTGTTTIGGALTIASGTLTVGPYTLTVSGSTSVTGRLAMTSSTGTKTFTGDVTINSGGIWDNTSGNESIDLAGSLRNDGTINAGTGVYTFSGATKTISGVNIVPIPNLTINGTVTNNGVLAASTALAGTGTLTNGAGATLNIGGTSAITTLTCTAALNLVNYNGAAQTVKPIAYQHLTLSGSGAKTLTGVGTITGNLSLSGTCTAATAVATAVGGNLTVGTGTTFTVAGFDLTVTGTTSVSGTLAHSSATGTKTYNGRITIDLGGSWTNGGNSAITLQGGLTYNGTMFSSGTGVYTFGTNTQVVDGGSALTISNVTVNAVTLTNSATSFTVSTALNGTGDLVQGTSATLNIGGTSGITTLDASAGTNTVNYSGGAQTVKPTTYHHLTLSGSGAKTLTSVGTINGNLSLSGTCSATTAISVTIGGNLSVGSGTTFTVAGFGLSVTGTTSVNGTLAHSSATGTKLHNGLVTVESGGAWTNAGNSAITFQGGLIHNGATFSSGTGVYTFSANSQSLDGAGAVTISNVTVDQVTLTNNLTNFTVSTALNGTGELLQGAGATLILSGVQGITTLDAITNPNTVTYNGAAQTVPATAYHHLTLSGSGVKTLPASSLTVGGDFTISGTASATAGSAIVTTGTFTIGSSASFDAGAYTLELKGGFSNNNTFGASGSKIVFAGVTDQSIGGSATTTFNDLTIDKLTGKVVVNRTFNVSGTLTFAGGNISTGANAVVVTGTGSVSHISGHVVGDLRKHISAASPSQTFEIGDPNNYAPLSLSFSGITADGDLTASTSAGDHADIANSTINPLRSVNRSWRLTNSGIAFIDFDAIFNFSAGDIDAGANPDLFKPGRYAGGVWSYPMAGIKGPTGTEATAVDAFGDFAIGEDRPDPPVLASIGARSVPEGDTLVVGISATDPDGDSLSLSAVNLPPNADLTDNGNGTAILTFSPTFTQAGAYTVTFIVSDGILLDSEIVVITVTAVNAPPALAAIGALSVPEGDTLSATVTATDSDGDGLTLSAEDLPTGAAFVDHGNGTGSLTFSPDYTQAGAYDVTFIVFDGALADSESVSITVTGVNRKPLLFAIGAQSIAENQTLNLHVRASDSDGTVPSLTALNLPANATFTDSTNGAGALIFSPDYTQAGSYSVILIASDGSLTDTQMTAITVSNVNRVPVLTAIGAQSVLEGDTLNIDVSAMDPDDDSLTLSAENVPTNAAFVDLGSGTGNVRFIPDYTQAGMYSVTIIASDGALVDSEVVAITVSERDPVTISGSVGLAGVTLSYVDDSTRTTITDSNGEYTFAIPYDWSGTVTPSMTGYTFVPTARSYTNIVSDQLEQDYAPSIVAGVDDDLNDLIPDRFALGQNYPNPFNPTTTIDIALPTMSFVTVDVFNIVGQRVATLIQGQMEAGEHRLQWDGRDHDGRQSTSGVYFYRLQADSFVEVKKMLLLK